MIYFGGKRKIVREIWRRFGKLNMYIEPFCGSAAILLGRPRHLRCGIEYLNDLDGMLVNVWRAIKADPDGVAKAIPLLAHEWNLLAVHRVLQARWTEIQDKCKADLDFHDAELAGYWLYRNALWIGLADRPGTAKLPLRHRGGVLAMRPQCHNMGVRRALLPNNTTHGV